MGDSTFKWIVSEIRQNMVVPIIGTELYVDQDEQALEPVLARELALELQLPPDIGVTPREVALHWLTRNQNGKDSALYQPFRDVYARVLTAAPPSLAQLAQITDFHVYVTTSIDGKLEDALRQEGRTPTVVSYELSGARLRLPDGPTAETPTVVHLLGHLETSDFAATEASVLRRIQALLREKEPSRDLYATLSGRDLLFLGCGFPDWLSRFFIHAVTQGILSEERSRVIADERVLADPHLATFLSHHHKLVLYRPGGARELLKDIRGAWTPSPPPDDTSGGSTAMRRRSVFLSYASEDRTCVEAIAAELEAAGVPVWFDRDALKGGDNWRRVIRANIEKADLFVPFMSRHTMASSGDSRYLHVEWNMAEEVSTSYLGTFVVPVALDPMTADEARAAQVPAVFLSSNWIRLHERSPTQVFTDAIKEAFRERRRRRHGVSSSPRSSGVEGGGP